MEEKDLILGCIAGDRACEKELFHRFSGKMLSVCMRYMGNYERAEDIVQEGFIKVFNSLDKFNFKGSFEGYIRRIMINTALRELSRFRNQKESFGYEYDNDSADFPDVISKMTVEEIQNLINQLPHGYRLVFNLYVIDGYSHQEIAERLNIAVSTSRSQLVKARKQLQLMISKLEKTQP